MQYVSASDAKQRLAAVIDTAQREPVTIRRQNREVAVLLSPADYKRLTTTNVEESQRFCDRVSGAAMAQGMSEEVLSDLLGASSTSTCRAKTAWISFGALCKWR